MLDDFIESACFEWLQSRTDRYSPPDDVEVYRAGFETGQAMVAARVRLFLDLVHPESVPDLAKGFLEALVQDFQPS